MFREDEMGEGDLARKERLREKKKKNSFSCCGGSLEDVRLD